MTSHRPVICLIFPLFMSTPSSNEARISLLASDYLSQKESLNTHTVAHLFLPFKASRNPFFLSWVWFFNLPPFPGVVIITSLSLTVLIFAPTCQKIKKIPPSTSMCSRTCVYFGLNRCEKMPSFPRRAFKILTGSNMSGKV